MAEVLDAKTRVFYLRKILLAKDLYQFPSQQTCRQAKSCEEVEFRVLLHSHLIFTILYNQKISSIGRQATACRYYLSRKY